MRKALAIGLAIVAIPLAAIAGIISAVLRLKEKRTAAEVATSLRAFVDGGGGARDWDDFVSLPIADPRLDEIRRRAAAVDLPTTEKGEETLRALLVEAERLAAVEVAGAE